MSMHFSDNERRAADAAGESGSAPLPPPAAEVSRALPDVNPASVSMPERPADQRAAGGESHGPNGQNVEAQPSEVEWKGLAGAAREGLALEELRCDVGLGVARRIRILRSFAEQRVRGAHGEEGSMSQALRDYAVARRAVVRTFFAVSREHPEDAVSTFMSPPDALPARPAIRTLAYQALINLTADAKGDPPREFVVLRDGMKEEEGFRLGVVAARPDLIIAASRCIAQFVLSGAPDHPWVLQSGVDALRDVALTSFLNNPRDAGVHFGARHDHVIMEALYDAMWLSRRADQQVREVLPLFLPDPIVPRMFRQFEQGVANSPWRNAELAGDSTRHPSYWTRLRLGLGQLVRLRVDTITRTNASVEPRPTSPSFSSGGRSGARMGQERKEV